jgi:hypothetical protein
MLCQDYYAEEGHPSIPPGRYAWMLFIGQCEVRPQAQGHIVLIAWDDDKLFAMAFAQPLD